MFWFISEADLATFQIRTSSILPENLVPIDVIGISDGIDRAQFDVLSIAIPSRYNFAFIPSLYNGA